MVGRLVYHMARAKKQAYHYWRVQVVVHGVVAFAFKFFYVSLGYLSAGRSGKPVEFRVTCEQALQPFAARLQGFV